MVSSDVQDHEFQCPDKPETHGTMTDPNKQILETELCKLETKKAKVANAAASHESHSQ
jgi:hypothetical protein